ncbi:MAG: alpha/beta fold hydrolase [Gammaproteobacteria bacterium]
MFRLLELLLPHLPASTSAWIVCRLAFHPYRYRIKPEEVRVRQSGQQFLYGSGLHAWKWGRTGPVVVLVHGWGGASVQWRRFIQPLVDAGYRVVAPDISGHGMSSGRRIGFDSFAEDLATLSRSLGPDGIHAFVGHSAGGLGMMAARYLHGLEARKFVCIATPSYPYPPVKVLKRKLRLPDKVTELFKVSLARQFRTNWDQISARAFREAAEGELMLIYDRRDRYLDGDDVERILAFWPGARVYLTENIGHENLIRADESIETVLAFLKA